MKPGTSTSVSLRGNVEGVAETDEPGGFVRGIDVEAAGLHQRLVGDQADRPPEHAAKPDSMFSAYNAALDFQKLAIVDYLAGSLHACRS